MLPQIRRDVEKRMETLGDAAPSYEDSLKEKSLLKMSRKDGKPLSCRARRDDNVPSRDE